MELSATFTEDGVKFNPPAYLQRYGAVSDRIKDDPRLANTIHKVVDFGCAELSLFTFLKSNHSITSILEVDYDLELLERFHSRAEPLFYDHLFQRETPLRVSVLRGSIADPDFRLIGCDAVIAIEIIEHLDVGAFDRMPHNIFGFIKPKVAFITTPNADFNVLFKTMQEGDFRHYDHRFEWTREQFQDWANHVVTLYPDYTVEIVGIANGPEKTEALGCCSQMAIFYNDGYEKKADIDVSEVQMDLSNVVTHNSYSVGYSRDYSSRGVPTNSELVIDCQVDVDISPPYTPTAEDPLDINENASGINYGDLVMSPRDEHALLRNLLSSHNLPFSWDAKPWENEAVTRHYKSIAEYNYPVYVDPRSREKKIYDDTLCKVNAYVGYDLGYFDNDEDVWRLPLPYLLSLISGIHKTTVDEIKSILLDAGCEFVDDCLIFKKDYPLSEEEDDIAYEESIANRQDSVTVVTDQCEEEEESWDDSNPYEGAPWINPPTLQGEEPYSHPPAFEGDEPFWIIPPEDEISHDQAEDIAPSVFLEPVPCSSKTSNTTERLETTNPLNANQQTQEPQECDALQDVMSFETFRSHETFSESNDSSDITLASNQNGQESRNTSRVGANGVSENPVDVCPVESHHSSVINVGSKSPKDVQKSSDKKSNESLGKSLTYKSVDDYYESSQCRQSEESATSTYLTSHSDSLVIIGSHETFIDSIATQATMSHSLPYCVETAVLNNPTLTEESDGALGAKLEDSCNLSEEKSPSSPLAQFCNANKDKDGTELSDSGYLKSQDSPQSPVCSDSFSNDLITPDKDLTDMIQSTILECIPENLNCVNQTIPSPKGHAAKNSGLRRKSVGPISDLEPNDEFSGCSSIARPKSLHVCTTSNAEVDQGDFKMEKCTVPVDLARRFSNHRNENQMPVHRHFNVPEVQADERHENVEPNRPNFLDVQILQVAVLDHENNNVDFEGNHIDENEGLRGNADEDMEAENLIRQRMDIHNENHLENRMMEQHNNQIDNQHNNQHEDNNHDDDGVDLEHRGEIVEEGREPCLGGNYGCNPKIIPSSTIASPVGTHPESIQCSSNLSKQEEDDAFILISSIEKTLSLQSKENIFMDESPCCSKAIYNLSYGGYMDKNIASTSKDSTDGNFVLERKGTKHCTTMLYNTQDLSCPVSDLSFNNQLNTTSMTNLFQDSNNSRSSSSKNSSDCNVVESKEKGIGLEGCLTIISSHLNKCFSSSSFLDWNLADIEDSKAADVTYYSSEENIAVDAPIVPVETKAELKQINHESSAEIASNSSRLDLYFSAEDQSILPEWFTQIINENLHTENEILLSLATTVYPPVERQAGGDGVGVHSFSSTHSSGHASMTSVASHTNPSMTATIDQQTFSFNSIPVFQLPGRTNYESSTSSSDCSIDLQIPMDMLQDSRNDTCQCDYCQTNNSDNTSHHNYTCLVSMTHDRQNLIKQDNNTQDSSDDTYQSHSYKNTQRIRVDVDCSSPENNFDSRLLDDQQPESMIELSDDFSHQDSFVSFDDAKALSHCTFVKVNPFVANVYKYDSVHLRGVPSDLSGNYADIETDMDSETD